MNSHRTNTELTPAERDAYAALRRDGVVDAAAEERTVAALRASGLFAQRDAPTPRRSWIRPYAAIAGAAAAIVITVIGASRMLEVRRHATLAPPHIAPAPESAAAAAPVYVVWY